MTETTKPEPISEARLDELIEWYSDDSLIGPWDESVVSALRELKALRHGLPEYVYQRSANSKLLYCVACGSAEMWIPEYGHDEGCKFAGIPLPAPPAPRTEEK